MEFIKRQRVGAWVTLGVALMTIAAIIVYCVSSTAAGYFRNTLSGAVVTFGVLAAILLLGAVALAQLEVGGTAGKCIKVAADVMRVGATLLLIASLLMFVLQRVEGLAYIFGSNEDVSAEVQTPENLASARMAIAGFIVYGITWLLTLASTFFPIALKPNNGEQI